MSKTIVILNGSPRGKGNTAALVKAFAEGAESAGNTVRTFVLDQMDIHGCKACNGGDSRRDCPCVQKDDMVKIYPEIRNSDIVVFASPLYYWNLSGQLRTAVDRLYALEEKENLLRGHGRACVLLMAAAGNAFEDVVMYYDHLAEHLQWKNLGHITAGGNWEAGDIEGKEELQRAFALGASV